MDNKPLRELLIQLAIDELQVRRFAVTEQYLEVLTLTKAADGSPAIAEVVEGRADKIAIVYFPIEGERFFLTVYLDIGPTPQVRGVGVEAGSRVYFKATSATFTLSQMSALTAIPSTEGWSRGEPRKTSRPTVYDFSCFIHEPSPHFADPLEDKFTKLLRSLATDSEGIKNLIKLTDANIQVVTYNHYGNGYLGGIHLDQPTLQGSVDLGLEIDFELYVGGQPIH